MARSPIKPKTQAKEKNSEGGGWVTKFEKVGRRQYRGGLYKMGGVENLQPTMA